MPTVYIVSKSSHDFSDAKNFGKLVYLSEGVINRYHINNMIRQFMAKLSDSKPEDYILPCGLSIMNAIACTIFGCLHGRLNILLFKKGRYVERNAMLEGIVFNKNNKED